MFVWPEDARDLSALGYANFDDNYFCLLSNESRTLTVTWTDVPVKDQRLEISAWNAERILLDLSSREGANLADVCICVPGESTPVFQERHLPIFHVLCAMLEAEFFA